MFYIVVRLRLSTVIEEHDDDDDDNNNVTAPFWLSLRHHNVGELA